MTSARAMLVGIVGSSAWALLGAAACGDSASPRDATDAVATADGTGDTTSSGDGDGLGDVTEGDSEVGDGADDIGDATEGDATEGDTTDADTGDDGADDGDATVEPRCGDGVPDPGEACDDGNESDVDGCDRACHVSAVLRRPVPGEVVVSELMIDPAAVPDPRGEWIELTSLATETLNLAGCELRDDGTDRVVFEGDGERVALATGARFVAGLDGDLADNGGVELDYVYATMLLDNVGDEIALVCDGEVVDRVAWTPFAWPIVSGRALSLDPTRFDPAADDSVSAWCLADRAYGDGDRGTPGAVNASCPQLDQQVDACRLVIDAAPSAFAGAPRALDVEVYEPGITDATDGVDATAALVVEVGWGPTATSPEGLAWTWARADGESAVAVATHADGYRGAIVVPEVGVVAALGRASRDGGATWRLCDRAGALPATPVALTVVASPCVAGSCATPPPATCAADGVRLDGFEPEGRCLPKTSATFECAYEPRATDCGADALACVDGACSGTPRRPAAGEVLLTELMIAPTVGDAGQWVELEGQVDEPLDLTGCVLAATDSESIFPFTLDEPVVLGRRGRLVIGASEDLDGNGGAPVDRAWGEAVRLAPDLGSVTLRCEGATVDAVAWDVDAGWSIPTGASLALSPFRKNLDDNDRAGSWCAGAAGFGDGDRGTPGAANPPCPGDVVPVESCAFVSAAGLAPAAGTTATSALKVIARSLTAKTTKTDPSAKLRLEVGFTARGAGLASVAAASGWIASSPDTAWLVPVGQNIDGAEDRYVAAFRAPSAGAWDLFARASADGGNTWLACGAAVPVPLEPVASACDPDPCGAPPAPTCDADGAAVVVHARPSTCALAGAGYTCAFAETAGEDCAAVGAVCVDGACAHYPRAPRAGELVVSELMIAPATGELGEWVELTSTASEPLRLGGCTLASGPSERWVWPAPVLAAPLGDVVGPGEAAVVARSLSPATNGDAQPIALSTGIALDNHADWLELACDGVVIDTVAWDEDDGWVVPYARSLQLSGAALDARDDDFAASFCAPTAPTPRAPNLVCPASDAVLEGCSLDAPATLESPADAPVDLGVLVYDVGVTDLREGPDAAYGTLVELGLGPADDDPRASYDWRWSEAAVDPAARSDGRDRWSGAVVAGEVGTFALAARVSLDGGATWTLCDRDGLADGFAPDATLTADATPCLPNPCTQAGPPVCAGGLLVAGAAPGACAIDGDGALCTYPTVTFSCGAFGGCNASGTCNAPPAPPTAAGDLVISEVMRDSTLPAPDLGEWLELTNPTDHALDLRGCLLTDGLGEVVSVGGALPDVVPASGSAVFAQATDRTLNGGLAPTSGPVRALAGMTLGNVADTVIVVCGGVEIDRVQWGFDWPGATGVSMQLDRGHTDATANDSPSAWCPGTVAYGTAGNKGSPGLTNLGCPTPP